MRRHFPQLPILARARNRVHYFALRDLGIKWIYRETFPASLEAAHQALLQLGLGIATSERAITMFKQHDEAQLEAQYAVRHDDVQLVQNAKDAAEQLRGLFESDVAGPLSGLLQTDGRRAGRGTPRGTRRHELRESEP